ncbi:MAG: hypothetical protein V1790_16270 [Planctomycetota bacterium]
MGTWLEEYREKRRRALCRREIEAAISEVKGHRPDDPAWREWYRALVLRRRSESAAEQEGRYRRFAGDRENRR